MLQNQDKVMKDLLDEQKSGVCERERERGRGREGERERGRERGQGYQGPAG